MKKPKQHSVPYMVATIFDRYFSSAIWMTLKIYAISYLSALLRATVRGDSILQVAKRNMLRTLPIAVLCVVGFGMAQIVLDWRLWRAENKRRQVGFFDKSRDDALSKVSGLPVYGIGVVLVLVVFAAILLIEW